MYIRLLFLALLCLPFSVHATTLHAEARSATEAQAKREALAALADSILVNVQSESSSYVEGSGKRKDELRISSRSDIPLIGVDINIVPAGNETICKVSLDSSKSLALYSKKLSELASQISTLDARIGKATGDGEVKGVGESGLILTPPMKGTLEDDGYLSASEIAKLNLNADWVILSACNTAASDGTPGAEGLSGLAKAFFYAGARSLLVSHWPVASEATVPLTTGMLKEYKANPGQGKAEAQRKAMLALMATPNHPEYANPIYWAPFVVVGEGGAGTLENEKVAGKR